ncbi:aminotransferase family protein [Butyrivibrio sp. YAB3001]|uniref:aminotransferase family protein n=1 Tax=Butyrivibrio sp. YAB3001 TaxID=1520812 RepID=UPI0008F67EA2|nr:aminotransferase class III-fold pyridoxal phosphate-dependent enzyme [Butyrivibrio sp. YAB3001]SFC13071.1 Aminotransferase class-III [Butyrivibrio sp. YAB3001]
MYQKDDGEKVWAAFKEMDTYLDKSFQIIDRVDEDNNYYNTKGQKMYDGVSTLLNTNIGHRNKEMIKAITDQLEKLDNTSLFCATNDVSIKCAKKLCELTDNHFFSAFFTNSGSESCDTAMKIAMKYNYNKGKRNVGVVALEGAYHGSNMTAMRLCQDQYDSEQYSADTTGYYKLTIPSTYQEEGLTEKEAVKKSLAEYKKIIKEHCIGAIYMELIQLSNSVYELPKEFVRGIVDISHENDVLVVVDEVATGFGRTGKMFASEHYGIWGDLMMFAKGVTSGYVPMGGVLATREVYESFTGEMTVSLDNGFTTGGHPVACAAALKNIEIMEREKLSENSEEIGKYLLEGLRETIGKSFLIKEIRGKGLMLAIIFEDYKVIGMPQFGISNIVTRFLVNNGMLLYPDSDETLILAPALNVDKTTCDFIIDRLTETVTKTEKCVSRRKEAC